MRTTKEIYMFRINSKDISRTEMRAETLLGKTEKLEKRRFRTI